MGSKSGSQITGYEYYMGMHVVPCRGPVDSVNSLIFGERTAWSGSVTENQQITVDAYNLFGGKSREGGVKGAVDILMGAETQGTNAYLQTACNGGTSSADVSSAPYLTSLITTDTTSSTVTSATQIIYTMTATSDNDGDVTYVVTKSVSNAAGDVSAEQLISTTYPDNEDAESDANAVFVRTSETTSSTDGLSGVTTTQTVIQISTVPAYRGLLSLVFKHFMFAAVNPYFKTLWVNVTRIKKGWFNDYCWYPAKAKIGTYDMNPAHIIYQAMTDPDWGLGEAVADFDDAVWRAAADKLYAEGFGLSMRWTKSSPVKSFVQQICDHINATVRLNIRTGLIELILIRDDYEVGDLTVLDVDNITEVATFERAAWGELCSQVIVNYTTRDDQTTSISVQDGAAVRSQGGVVTSAKDYPFIREAGIALRVAQRDLQIMSSPLCKITFTCNRVLWSHEVGDVIVVNWAPLNVSGVVFRISSIDKGSITSGTITVTAVEDVFALPATTSAASQGGKWVNPLQAAHAAIDIRLVESPYWDVVRTATSSEFASLPDDFAFVETLAKYGSGSSSSFNIYTASTDVMDKYTLAAGAHYSPRAVLSSDLSYLTTSLYYVGATGLDVSAVGEYAYIDDECVAIDAVDQVTGKLTIRRGILDTLPALHEAGATLWVSNGSGYDATVREAGEPVWNRILPTTAVNTLPVGSAAGHLITLKGRAQKPYPPGNIKVNDTYYPTVTMGEVLITWAHRNRLQQTVSFNDFTTASIGPEAGVTYTVEVLTPAGLQLHLVTGITDTLWRYTGAMADQDGNLTEVMFRLWSVRDGIASMQKFEITLERGGLGYALGHALGGALSGSTVRPLGSGLGDLLGDYLGGEV